MATCAVVVGYGSIGARHAGLLRQLGCTTSVVSRRPIDFEPRYAGLPDALAAEQPDYVVIANETSGHRSALEALVEAGFEGTVLVEKPLLDRPPDKAGPEFATGYVGYNLRFHPVLQALRAELADQRALSVQAYVGQYLPQWRPDTDYRAGYSAQAELGGGVLRDLSHEIDYLGWLFGPWKRLTAIGGKVSSLEIDSDDSWAILMAMAGCPMVTIHLNYLDRLGRREIIVNTDEHSYRADLIGGRLDCDGVAQDFPSDRDATFLAQHTAAMAGDAEILCSLAEGLAVVETLEAIEQAARDNRWIVR